jgi:TonB-linked SusC/RagA family outer membrane protein
MKKNLFFLLLFVISVWAQAQNRVVTGKITSAEKEPIPGVNVLVKGTSTGTTTNADGVYSISVARDGAVIVFSFIGFKTEQIEIGDRTQLDLQMSADLVNLNEVVVTANAIVREKKELGYAVSTVGGAELIKARDPNLLNSMAGRIAGVRISQQSGTVGGSTKVMIRGANSISSASEPLFVVDGIPISNSSFNNSETDAVTGGVDVGNRAGDINPDDVESMTVLKGAAASALYGSRARNGVIVITTKRGKPGSKRTNVSVNSSFRSDKVLRTPDMQDTYAQGVLGVYNNQLGNGWGPKISEIQGQVIDYKGELSTPRGYSDNWGKFFVTGHTVINSVAIDGATETSDYRVGYTNLKQVGTVPGSELGRHTIALNGGTKIGSKITSRAWVNYVRTTSDGRPAQGSNTENILATILTGVPATVDINELKNNLYATPSQAVPDGWTGDLARSIDLNGVQNNPYWVTSFNKFSNSVDRIFGGTSLSYDPTSWLNFTGRVGTDFFTENRRNVTRKGTRGRLNGQFETNDIFERELQTDLMASVTQKISRDWGFKGIIGHQFNQRTVRRSRILSQGLNIDQLYTFANAQSNVASNFYSRKEIFGTYADISFDFRNYLFVNLTGRNDWSSTLPVANNSYFYPSASVSFVLTEAFSNLNIVKNDILSYAKLRANYANVGSDEDPYQLAFTYNPLIQATDIYTFNILYPIGGASAFGATNVLPPTNLKPQRQTSYELGAEMKFFGGRVGLDFTWYKSLNYDQIISIAVPQTTGYSSKRLNIGEISNNGIEAMLTLTPIKTSSGFRWDAAFNFNKNKNKVESLAPGLDELILTSGDGFGIFVVARPGETFNIQGVGWLRDPDGNIIINETTGLRTPGARKLLGNIYPDWTMGINNSFSYKGFDLNFLVDIRKGGVINSQTVSIIREAGMSAETAVNDRKPIVDPGVIKNADGTFRPNDVPVASMEQYWSQLDNTNSPEGNTFDASYAKLREVRLAYNLPKNLISKTPFGNISVGVEGRNLWIIKSHVPHIDPESNVLGTGLIGEGLERGSIPSTRSFGANLRFTF